LPLIVYDLAQRKKSKARKARMEETDICDTDQETRLEIERQSQEIGTQQKNSNFDRVQFVHYTIASAIVFAKITVSTYAFLMKRGTKLIVPGMKDTSEVKGKPFSSSLNSIQKLTIERGGGGWSTPPPPRHPPYYLPSPYFPAIRGNFI
jgi:hypothetical protein